MSTAQENMNPVIARALEKYVGLADIPDEFTPDNDDGWTPQEAVPAAVVALGHAVSDDTPVLRCDGTWDDIENCPISVSLGTGKYSSVTRHDTTYGGLFHMLARPAMCSPALKKEQMATIAPCVLNDYSVPPAKTDDDGKTIARPKNLKQERVAQIGPLLVDVDGGQALKEATAVLDALGVGYLAYATNSHTREKPRFRIVIAIDPFTIEGADDRAVFAETYRLVVGIMLGIRFDQSCTDANQYYYLPHFKVPKLEVVPAADWRDRAAQAQRKADIDAARNAALQRAVEDGDYILEFRPGGLLNFGEVADHVRKHRAAKTSEQKAAPSAAEYKSRTPLDLQTRNIARLVYSCAAHLNIEAAYRYYADADVGAGGDGGWLHCRCGNDRGEVSGRKHTDGFDSAHNKTEFAVKNGADGRGFSIHCQTSGCKETFRRRDGGDGQDRLLHLDALCQRWGVKDAEELLEHCFDPGAARKAYDEWGQDFQRDDNGCPYKNQHNIGVALRKLGVTLSFNEFTGCAYVSGLPGYGPELTDDAMESLRLKIDRDFRVLFTDKLFNAVIADTARHHRFHPVRDYLDRVQTDWDGVERLDAFVVQYLGAENTELNRAIGRLWLIAAVRRIRAPGCKFDEIPTLIGPQGGEKSSALATLAVREDWFSDNVDCGADSKVVIELTRGKWIIEIAELAGMSGKDVERVKAFASRQTDRARLAYGRIASNVPRAFVMAGTSNNRQVLKDRSGNRRFWPIDVGSIDLAALRRDVDQLWGEAAVCEARGESIRLPRELWGAAAAVQEEHEVEDPYLDTLARKLRNRTGRIARDDVYRLVDAPPPDRRHQGVAEGVAKAMAKLGWEKKKVRIDGVPVSGFVRGDESDRLTITQESDRSWTVEESTGRPFDRTTGGRG